MMFLGCIYSGTHIMMQKYLIFLTSRRSFWWRDILKLNITFRGIAKCSPDKGYSISLWEDCFVDQPLSLKFSQLYSLEQGSISMQRALSTMDLFRLPMSRTAFNEFRTFQQVLIQPMNLLLKFRRYN